MASESDPLKLSSPRIFLVRMMIFVILGGLVAFVLYKQIENAFLANPGLNALIIGVLAIGILLALRQVIRHYPEIRWDNNFRLGDPGLAVERPLLDRQIGGRRRFAVGLRRGDCGCAGDEEADGNQNGLGNSRESRHKFTFRPT